MLEALLAVAVTVIVLAVVVPLALTYLLLRQVLRSRLVRWLLIRRRARRGIVMVASWSPVRRPTVQAPRQQAPPRMGRRWAALAADAVVARERFVASVDAVPGGPLRDALNAAVGEVDAAVAEAQRLAAEGSAAEAAHRQVLGALEQQRRQRRRASFTPGDVDASLSATLAAQDASARRLEHAGRQTLCRLQLVVARLHELTAHTLELATVPRGLHEPPAALSIADRVAAIRAATDEVEIVANGAGVAIAR